MIDNLRIPPQVEINHVRAREARQGETTKRASDVAPASVRPSVRPSVRLCPRDVNSGGECRECMTGVKVGEKEGRKDGRKEDGFRGFKVGGDGKEQVVRRRRRRRRWWLVLRAR